MKLALVACGRAKLDHAAPARDLYTSTLFRLARSYAETFADDWRILSAQHGLLHPSRFIAPYERALKHLDSEQRAAWGRDVRAALTAEFDVASLDVVVLAGNAYRQQLTSMPFASWWCPWDDQPGMGFGHQMGYMRQALDEGVPRPHYTKGATR